MLLGDRIRQIRLSKHMKQSDLAEKANISRVAVGNYERGDREPTAKILQQIALALGVSPSELLGWDELEQQAKEYDDFTEYVKSLGYVVTEISEPCLIPEEQVLKQFKEELNDEHCLCGETFSVIVSNKDVKAIFTQEEFEALQMQNKANIDGAILLQSQKNKKEPSSAATDNGSDDENTIK